MRLDRRMQKDDLPRRIKATQMIDLLKHDGLFGVSNIHERFV